MKRTLLLTLVFVCGLSLATLAATPPSAAKKTTGPKPAPDGSRFLLVVDTSASMKPIDPATRRIVFDLAFTGVEGYMRTGDTMGMWTFNDEIGAGKFPMQVWDGQNPVDTASRAAMFVRDQEYKGENSIEELMIQLAAVMRAAKDVNIFIFSDGDTPMQGTPFDREINAVYSKRGKERKSARKPFVTTLVVRGGQVASAFVVLGGESIQLPERPAPAQAAIRLPASAATNSPAARPVAAPAAGKPRASVTSSETDSALPEQAASRAESFAAESPVIARIPRAAPLAPDPREPNLDQPKALPVEATSTVAVAGPIDTQNELPPASDDLAPAPRKKVMQIITLPSAPAPKNEQAAKPPASAETNTTPAVALVTTPAPASPAPPTSTPAVPLPPPAANPDAAKLSPSTQDASAPTVKPPVAATVAQTAGSNQSPALLLPAPIVAAARESAASPSASTPSVSPALAAMQVPATPALGAMPALIFGGIMLALSLFLLGVALRRFRHESQGSLITQSMHRR